MANYRRSQLEIKRRTHYAFAFDHPTNAAKIMPPKTHQGSRQVYLLPLTDLGAPNVPNEYIYLPAPTDRPDPQLLRASAELRAAYREITHDTTTTMSPDAIAQHPGLERALSATLAAIESAPELADVLAEKASQPGLVGRSRALSRRAHNDIEAGLATPDPSGDVVWVSPADIRAKRMVDLPRPVEETLRASTDQARRASAKAASTATCSPLDWPGAGGRDLELQQSVCRLLPVQTNRGPNDRSERSRAPR